MNNTIHAQTEEDQLLRFKVMQGFERFGLTSGPKYLERAEYELGIITSLGFSGYFLLVADLCRFMRENKIRFLVRGSGCGSVCIWSLGISHKWLDPVTLELPFERFLNPDRVSNPDLDIDIDDHKRHLVVEYCQAKYGHECVAKIGTFGTLGAKAALQDIARALRLPDYQTLAQRVSSSIPGGKGVKLADELQTNEFLQEQASLYPEWFELAQKVEGKVRQAGVHAAGIIISPGPLTDLLPLHWRGDSDGRKDEQSTPVTQWDMYDVEEFGMLKVDFLGLATLHVVEDAVATINAIRVAKGLPGDFDIDTIDQYDEATWAMLDRGDLAGVFQVEKDFVRKLSRRMNLLARRDPWQMAVMVAMIRPGMLDTGQTDVMLRRASGEEEATPLHPLLKETLEKTHGILCFQEDVMLCSRDLSGFSMSEADVLRKGVGKKKPEFIAKMWPKFLEGAMQPRVRVTYEQGGETREMITKPRNPELVKLMAENGMVLVADDHATVSLQTTSRPGADPVRRYVGHEILMPGASEEDTKHIWSLIEAHARYSFNSAHAAAYGVVLAYETAYLKAHYPLEYMKALINSESGKSDKESGYNFKVGEYVEEARCMGLTVLPPCVTRSAGLCRTVPAKNAIRFGLEMIKGVSGGAAEWIQKQCRDASGLVDFALKCFEVVKDEQRDRHTVRARVSKSDIEGLVHAGAMDIFNPDRCKLLALAPKVMELAKKYHTQQAKLLDGSTRLKILPEQIEAELNALFMEDDDPAIERLRLEQLLDMERQVTGCFLSQSPFDPFRDVMREYCTTSFSEIEAGEYTMTNTIGLLKGFREITVKRGKSKGKSMAFMTFHGTGGTLEVTCFPRTWEAWSKDGIRIETNKVYLIQIERDTRGDSHLANNVRRLSDAGFDGSLAVA